MNAEQAQYLKKKLAGLSNISINSMALLAAIHSWLAAL